MTRKAKYVPCGDEITTEVAYMQAANLLDVAAAIAIEQRSLESMQTLSVLWMELGERMLVGSDEDDEDGNGKEPVILGFGNGGARDNERVD